VSAATSSPLVEKYHVHPQALVESLNIGGNTRIWAFAHILRGARIGANCNIGDHAFVEGDVVLGDNVTVSLNDASRRVFFLHPKFADTKRWIHHGSTVR